MSVMVTDPIADLLTRVRNANKNTSKEVMIPFSNLKKDIVNILKEEGYIEGYKIIKKEPHDEIIVSLKYVGRERVIKGLKRISKPGLRVYVKKDDVPKVRNGLGIAIISTSNGVITDKEARKNNVGGEVLAYIW